MGRGELGRWWAAVVRAAVTACMSTAAAELGGLLHGLWTPTLTFHLISLWPWASKPLRGSVISSTKSD